MFYNIKETNFPKKYCFRGRSNGIPPSVKGRGSQRQTGGWIGMRRVNDGRRTSRRLRTTVSAHHVVPPSTLLHFLICLSLLVFLALFGFLLLVPHVFFFSFLLLLFTAPSLHFVCSFLHSLTPLLTSVCFNSCLRAVLHLSLQDKKKVIFYVLNCCVFSQMLCKNVKL